MIGRLIPLRHKQLLKARIRVINDFLIGFKTQKEFDNNPDWYELCRVKQEIHNTPFVDEKMANLCLAFSKMDNLLLRDGGVFSLWAIIGNPDEKYGWQSGRTRINDIMTTSPGGGLCQLSTLLYHLALLSGFEIIERFPHSADGYDENQRYTPLGIDATILYGYKDLRFRNICGANTKFKFIIENDYIEGIIYSQSPREKCTLTINRQDTKTQKIAQTTRTHPNGTIEFISNDIYKIDNG